ncbi:MAG TPA: hypothetical protein VE596_10120 [Gaiellaceae bacterium]|nr:hypothetical protein [Gaiellaceae bacterium]
MIEIPTALAVAQWALLLGLAVLLVVAYRQLAYLMQVGQAASSHGGLAVDAEAPAFEYEPLGAANGTKRFEPRGAPAVLMFTDPGCGSCEKALLTLDQVTRALRLDGLRVLAVTSADDDVIEAIGTFGDTSVEVGRVDPGVPRRLYDTYVTPYFYAIGADGRIRGRGAAESEDQIGFILGELTTTTGREGAGGRTEPGEDSMVAATTTEERR